MCVSGLDIGVRSKEEWHKVRLERLCGGMTGRMWLERLYSGITAIRSKGRRVAACGGVVRAVVGLDRRMVARSKG